MNGTPGRSRLGRLEARAADLVASTQLTRLWLPDPERPGWLTCPATGEAVPELPFRAAHPRALRLKLNIFHPHGDWGPPDDGGREEDDRGA